MTNGNFPIYDQDQSFWESQLHSLQEEPIVWALNADSLIRAFELLAKQAELDRVDEVRYHQLILQQDESSEAKPSRTFHPPVGGGSENDGRVRN